jgi:NAD-dependent deacetylase
MQASPKDIATAQKLVTEAKSICVLTGSGISAESGINTFRGQDGLWEKHRLEDVATPEGFAKNPKLVWEFYNARRRKADIAAPNPGHLALARMELSKRRQAKRGATPIGHANGNGNGNGNGHPKKPKSATKQPFVLLTQNIDGLHQQAGSVEVVELHGSLWKVRCTECGVVTSDHPIELPILPKCETCRGLLRPHVVWFGEMLEPEILNEAETATLQCDLFLVIGTSAIVQPAAAYPVMAAKRNVPVVEVNLERTQISEIATVCLLGKAGQILPKLVR